jgi:hypothetical protein
VKHENGIRARLRNCVLILLTLGAVAASAGAAYAATPLEGVWSFNGGKIAIHPEGSEGTLVGTVIAPTTFAACPHQVGESIWSEIKQQPDGSFFGRHQWFYEDGSCTPNPQLGPTAFRVLSSGSSRYLRVCLSEPGGTQPSIDGEGNSSGATFGCVDSELIAALPSAADLKPSALIELQDNHTCLAANNLRIRLHQPVGDTIVNSSVTVRGGGVVRHVKVAENKNGGVAIVHPSAFPGGSFVVVVKLKTALGRTITRKRTYRPCEPKKPRHRKPHHKHG